jgi:hypothetical protein
MDPAGSHRVDTAAGGKHFGRGRAPARQDTVTDLAGRTRTPALKTARHHRADM